MQNLLLIISLWLIQPWALAEIRNPFLPVEPRCSQRAPEWRYQGIIQQGNRLRGLVRINDKQWLRLSDGDPLPDGGIVQSLSASELTVSITDCPSVTLNLHQESTHEPPAVFANPVISATRHRRH